MIQKLPKNFLYFLGAVFIINLLQSYFTQLIYDESYYWYYAQKMAWGYFDHPPMVALLIKISSFFFNGELGVRFMSTILSIGTIILIWFMIDNENKKTYIPHFFAVVFSMTLLNAYGFLTLPDTPLLFFTALFLWIYKKFIVKPSIIITIALGLTMAALMYSKYHAVLVIVFVLLSNIKLVTNKYAWLAVIIALVCYTPHFAWLYDNDFVSIKYHLLERPNQAYKFEKFTLGFFLNLIAIFGFTFPWMYYALYQTKTTDKFSKALVYLVYGVIIFFFISSFSKRVQTQWIIIISIPMAILAYNYMLKNSRFSKGLYKSALTTISIILFLRVALVYQPLIPFFIYETHYNKEWVNNIVAKVGDTPVVFENSYRRSPMYAFYSGSQSYSLNNIHYRQNQYTIDSSQYKMQHKRVLYVSDYLKTGDHYFENKNTSKFWGKYIDDFESFRNLECIVDNEIVSLKNDDTYTLKVYNPYPIAIDLKKIKYRIAYTNEYKRVKEVHLLKTQKLDKSSNILKAKDTTLFSFKLPTPNKLKEPGYFKLSISENNLPTGINSNTIKLH